MDSCYWLTFLILLLGQGSQPLRRQKRLLNSVEVTPGEIPYQVSIQAANIKNHHHCGGVIIDEYHFLTAAHCMDGFETEDFQVVAGTVDLAQPYFVTYVSEIHVHEDYDASKRYKNDIAVVKVTEAFAPDNFINFATLPKLNESLTNYARGMVSGFGSTAINGEHSRVLRKTYLFIKSLEFCRKEYKKYGDTLSDFNICAHNANSAGIWKGDSGGPLIVNDVLHGIAISGLRDWTNHNYPSIFTKVSKYIPWILKLIDMN